MKPYALIITIVISAMELRAQPVFETTLQESASICRLESIGEVYYTMDVVNKQCHIYQMDRSLYKSIPLPTPQGYYLADVQHVSEMLFNEDGLIELVYIYSKYVATSESYYYTYETKLINENGNVLLTIPGAGYTQVFETEDYGKKFLVYEYNYSVVPWRTYTHIYSLPGSINNSRTVSMTDDMAGDPFPNPASQIVKIPVHIAPGTDPGIIELLDLQGRKVFTYPVAASNGHVVVPTDQLQPGTYLYRIITGQKRSPSRKIVIGR